MHYLIDGHNLIGRMPDIELDDPDDEVELVRRLRGWAARSRKRRVTLIFDRGLPGGESKHLSTGNVRVIFASQGRSADRLLIGRVKSAKNPQAYTLVSSDARIIREAVARRMPVMEADAFVRQLRSRATSVPSEENGLEGDMPLDESELAMWLDLFDSATGPQATD